MSKYNRSTEINKLDIFGGAYAGSLRLKLTLLFIPINISTSDVYFPLTWRYHISLNKNAKQSGNAVYEMEQRYKMMPGHIFKVEKGAELTIGEVNVYETFTDPLNVGHLYPSGLPGAELIVNGSLTASVLGGIVKTESESEAQLNVSSNTITTYETKTATSDAYEAISISGTLKLNMVDSNGVASATATEQSSGIYTSMNYGWALASGVNQYVIIYDANGGTELNDSSFYSFGDTYVVDESILPEPTKPYYSFDGWFYTDANGIEQSVDEYEMMLPKNADGTLAATSTSINVKAKWSVATLNITYQIEYIDCETTNNKNNPNAKTYSINNAVTLQPATDGILTFYGWYIDSLYEHKISEISYTTMSKIGLEDVTVYGYFSTKPTYTVKFDTQNSLFGTIEDREVIEGGTTTLPELTAYDNDITKPTYFGGWYTSPTCEDSTKFTSGTKITSNITLYAKWNNKITITYQFSNLTTDLGSSPIYRYQYAGDTLESIELTSTTDYYFTGNWLDESGNAVSEVPEENIILTADIRQVFEITFKADRSSILTITFQSGYYRTDSSIEMISMNTVTEALKFENKTTIYYMTEGSKFNASSELNWAASLANYSLETGSAQGDYTVTGKAIYYSEGIESSGGGCFAEGTLITLADGLLKPIEEITTNDYVLAWDFESGGYVTRSISAFFNHGTLETKVINLSFEDGTIIKVIDEHGFYDYSINDWVYINEQSYSSYIGHYFIKQEKNKNSYSTAKLIDVSITVETTGVYSLITEYTINCFANGFLSNTPVYGGEGIFHYFEIGENLQYDLDKMSMDIETYGLATYDEWKEYFDPYLFDKLNCKYFNVAIGKGLITKEKIIELAKLMYHYL